jgi:S1-C subfamily serine protease
MICGDEAGLLIFKAVKMKRSLSHFLGHYFTVSIVIVGSVVTGALRAQTAEQIVEKTLQSYTGLPSYEGEINHRSLTLIFTADGSETEPKVEVKLGLTTQVDIQWSAPNEWMIGRTERQEGLKWVALKGLVKVSGGLSQVSDGDSETSKLTRRVVPADQMETELNQIFYRTRDDFVIERIRKEKSENEGRSWGLKRLELKADELCQGQAAYRIEGWNTMGQRVVLWIDKLHYAVLRSLRISAGGRSEIRLPVPGAASLNTQGWPVQMVVRDTVYRRQQFGSNVAAESFALPSAAQLQALAADAYEFESADALVKLARGLMFKQADVAATPSAVPAVGVAQPNGPATTDAAAQVLTPEQMAGIIFIEGDKGTATGFITKIRGVSFVVTNLHVLGENKKITLTNLRGEVIPVLGIYGAVGVDVAILKIAKGESALRLAEDMMTAVKIGDKVVVVGNRQGGGVATQVAGQILGVGPSRVEVSANFEPGNSGSPIFSSSANAVIGVATYAQTRNVTVEDGPGYAPGRAGGASPLVEKRWFGYRLDGITKWEAIDLVKWHAQGERIDKFRETSEALVAVIRGRFRDIPTESRIWAVVEDFDVRRRRVGDNSQGVANEVKTMFRTLRAMADEGVRELTTGDYYDYYRTCLYWENSITAQLEYRREILEVIKKYEANGIVYASRLRAQN